MSDLVLTPQSENEVSLKRQIELVLGLAERAGHHRALAWIEKRWDQEHPSREWTLGTCIWCEVDFNCRREVTQVDLSGGPSICDLHDWLLPEPEPAQLRLLRDLAEGKETAGDYGTVEALEQLDLCGLINGRRLKWAGRKALEYADRQVAA